ncbi:MAG: endolytic transglycosylase MltG [Anaerolineae bacterium]
MEQIAVQIDQTANDFSGRDFPAVVAASAPIPAEFGFLASRPGGARLERLHVPRRLRMNSDTTAFSFRDMMPNCSSYWRPRGYSGGDQRERTLAVGRRQHGVDHPAQILACRNTRKIIASIFYNRRAREMGLGSFTTLQYALGGSGSWWPRITKANINTDTPYATHRYKGLPPTPISNPGLSAIIAVAYPAQTDYLYMNAKCDGSGNYYARTYEEFQAGLNCQ